MRGDLTLVFLGRALKGSPVAVILAALISPEIQVGGNTKVLISTLYYNT